MALNWLGEREELLQPLGETVDEEAVAASGD